MTEDQGTSIVVQSTPGGLQLSEQAIEVTKRNVQLCEQLVTDVLEKDVDYGLIPGVPQPFLWDAGAAKIMSAYNCYADYNTLRVIDQPGKIAITVTSRLINRQSQQVIATGIGAASTREIKHRYRWVIDPEAEGISRKGLKQNNTGKFRIPNPDTEDLLNTIAKMAAKRADVDAAQSLPGVAATLHKLFHPLPGQRPRPGHRAPTPGETRSEPEQKATEATNWKLFGAKLQTLGVSHKNARDILAVNSIKNDWVGVQGRSLEEAYDVIKDAWLLINAGKEIDTEWGKVQHTSDTAPTTEPLFQE